MFKPDPGGPMMMALINDKGLGGIVANRMIITL